MELGLDLNALSNSELTYEKKHELDLGADLGFVNNRINLVFDWYKRNNFDLIGRIYTEGVGGFSSKYANVAETPSRPATSRAATRMISRGLPTSPSPTPRPRSPSLTRAAASST